MFAKTVSEYQRITPLDKVCTKLVVKIKMRYCPEKETAISTVTKEINLVDGDDDEPVRNQGKKVTKVQEEEGYVFT